MLRELFSRIFSTSRKRVYVVIGEQIQHFDEPRYSTHPDSFNFSMSESWAAMGVVTESPSEFPPDPLQLPYGEEREVGPTVVKVFSDPADAISFTYHCNLASVLPQVYDSNDDGWTYSSDQSAFDVDW